ncbi:hypothetical protein JTE90_009594 [Oedothorax gibbosus]|uniref:Uncharacterized protein n=1 Tax=Oedothorax gibbosus TaxID=931172 RepID=A0AAV6VJR6_9ARAC|nr:hypothetical protein JTE90_009594 [Oedothorax gibbosus]
MFEYHATYGASKKIIKSESNLCKDIYGPIKKVFSLDRECSLHMQYWHIKYNDWVDCEESDKISDGSKLNVFLNLYSIPDIPYSSSLSTLSSPSAEIRCSTPSSRFSSPVHEECPPFDQQPSHQMDCEEFPHVYILPAFPPWCQTLLEECSPKCKEARCRRAVVDALFDDLLPYGQYPTSRMFQETARALVEAYPILKDQHIANAQPHDSWVLRLRDKFKKFRSRHADELSNAEEVQKMKAKFGGKRHNLNLEVENSLDNSLTPVKRMKVQDLSEWEEDQFSIDVHIKELREECQKRKPNADLIQDKMARTFTYRVSYITTHSVAETLNCFPPLKQTNELIIEGMRLGVTEADMKQFLIQKKTSLLHLAQNRKEKNNKVSQLLTAQAECACTEANCVADFNKSGFVTKGTFLPFPQFHKLSTAWTMPRNTFEKNCKVQYRIFPIFGE